jgi:hypothetical protein
LKQPLRYRIIPGTGLPAATIVATEMDANRHCFRNGHEVHLKPGAGDIDFADMFQRVEGKGFNGHYTNAFGSLDDMLAGRDEFVRLAGHIGIS